MLGVCFIQNDQLINQVCADQIPLLLPTETIIPVHESYKVTFLGVIERDWVNIFLCIGARSNENKYHFFPIHCSNMI